MNDRELLELAAKAAGMAGWRYAGALGMCKMINPSRPDATGSIGQNWNPLTDDGDALRLAVKVGMVIRLSPYGDHWVDVEAGELLEISVHEESTHDPYYNTRLAIVRAAAEIGRQMEVA